MKQKYISYWENAVQQAKNFYNNFKNHYKTLNYQTSSKTEKRALVKLTRGNQKLMIEIGRYEQIPRKERTCPVCLLTQTTFREIIKILMNSSNYLVILQLYWLNLYLRVLCYVAPGDKLVLSSLLLKIMFWNTVIIIVINVAFAIKLLQWTLSSRLATRRPLLTSQESIIGKDF